MVDRSTDYIFDIANIMPCPFLCISFTIVIMGLARPRWSNQLVSSFYGIVIETDDFLQCVYEIVLYVAIFLYQAQKNGLSAHARITNRWFKEGKNNYNKQDCI